MKRGEKSLGEKLRNLRESFNLSQGQVAEALNIDRSTYTNYELDKTRPNLETLVKLAHIYNVPPVQLLPEEDGNTISFKDVARPDMMLQSLNKDERGLIVYYRSLTAAQKDKLRAEMVRIAAQKTDEEAPSDAE